MIGTLPNRRDTDGDSFTDLVERARQSDPLDPTSTPEPADFSIGTCASQENGFVTILTAVFVKQSTLASVNLQIGFVYRGHAFYFSPSKFNYTRGFLINGGNVGETLAVVEVGIPAELLQHLGQVNMFSRIHSSIPGSEPMVSLLPIVNFGGVAMSVEPRAAAFTTGGGGGAGIQYRPLAGGSQIPSTWNSGQMCFQATNAIGMSGVSIVHEITAAECSAMDTYCSSSDCSGAVGQTLELPDPAALAGG